MQGDKEITARDGKKDIAWRTDVLDTLIEVLLVERYRIFTDIQQEAAVGCGDWQEEHFWDTLSRALDEDGDEMDGKCGQILHRHGKSYVVWKAMPSG